MPEVEIPADWADKHYLERLKIACAIRGVPLDRLEGGLLSGEVDACIRDELERRARPGQASSCAAAELRS